MRSDKLETPKVKCNLEIWFGHLDDEIGRVDTLFDLTQEKSWYTEDWFLDAIRNICNVTEIVFPGYWRCPDWFREGEMFDIVPKGLPSGLKALLLMRHTDYVISATRCGDNCAKYIWQIAQIKPIRITLNYSMFTPEVTFPIYCLNDNHVITDTDDLIRCMREYHVEPYEWIDS